MAEQAVQTITDLPDSPLAAVAAYFAYHHTESLDLLNAGQTSDLAIVLPSAGHDHNDWRRTLARDLARTYAPKRANVIGASDGKAMQEMLAYLRNAPGVTGQYLAAHE
ncbi:MAG: Rossmann fold domain-containing protein [Pseudomonadota bacterium]